MLRRGCRWRRPGCAGQGDKSGALSMAACRRRRRRDLSVAKLVGALLPRPHDLEVSDELLAAALTVRGQASREGQCADDHVRRIGGTLFTHRRASRRAGGMGAVPTSAGEPTTIGRRTDSVQWERKRPSADGQTGRSGYGSAEGLLEHRWASRYVHALSSLCIPAPPFIVPGDGRRSTR